MLKKRENHTFCSSRCYSKYYNFHDVAGRLIRHARARAAKKGLLCTITKEDILPLPKFCPILKTELIKTSKPDDPNNFSLDRIDPEKGYIPGNVQVISFRANTIKKDSSTHEVELLLNWRKKNNL